MISSMTGFGRGEASGHRMTAMVELRSVNNRFLEVSPRLPRSLSLRDNDVKEIIRRKIARGKVNVVITVTHESVNEVPVRINKSAARAYMKLLTELKKSVKLRETITLDHLLKFPEVLEIDEFEHGDDREWELVQVALDQAIDGAVVMRQREGNELKNDLEERLRIIEGLLNSIEQVAIARIPEERVRLEQKLKELISDPAVIDSHRLEFELAMYADRLDITEECVRFRSHNKFFLDALRTGDSAGRKLNFLIQEMNREANTIGSKGNCTEISHMVVSVKEELEKIREQLQNIE
jgi:uncharacterized protein (TIGR00255 family)